MFVKCETFVNIAELLFTDIFNKENICKNGQKKFKNVKISTKKNFINSQDMMT